MIRKLLPSDHPSSSTDSIPSESQSPLPRATGGGEPQNQAKSKATSFSRPIGRGPGISMAEKVLEKAQSNSTRTEITETIAPGKSSDLTERLDMMLTVLSSCCT